MWRCEKSMSSMGLYCIEQQVKNNETPEDIIIQPDLIAEGPRLSDEGGGSRRVVLERRGDLLLGLVVAGETVNAGFDENEAELGVLVLAVGLEMLADGDSLFDEVPEILRNLRSET